MKLSGTGGISVGSSPMLDKSLHLTTVNAESAVVQKSTTICHYGVAAHFTEEDIWCEMQA
eukprot:5785980-Amphidinium_carterae.1